MSPDHFWRSISRDTLVSFTNLYQSFHVFLLISSFIHLFLLYKIDQCGHKIESLNVLHDRSLKWTFFELDISQVVESVFRDKVLSTSLCLVQNQTENA